MSRAAAARGLRYDGAPAVLLALVVLASLLVVPYRVHLSPTGAEVSGFDPAVAHLLVLCGALGCVGLYAWFGITGRLRLPDALSGPAGETRARSAMGEALFLFLLMLLLYAPPILARYGPYGEDKYFFSSLQRLLTGQRPYADFEFLYGPLLLVPIASWLDVFGFSLQSYYWLLAFTEAFTFALLAMALGTLLPERRTRLAVLLVFVVLLLNDNLGLSWIALRRLLPVGILLLYALHGRRDGGLALAAMLIGVQLVTSLEYAAACVLAVAAMGVVEAYAAGRLEPALRAGVAVALGVAVGAVLAVAMLGADAGTWLTATLRVAALRGGGEAGFPFQASANAAAVLGLLFLAAARLGGGITVLRRRSLGSGDLMLVGATVYALVALKSGLARSDMYHLLPPVLGIVAATLLPLQSSVFSGSAAQRRLAVIATVLICATYVPGLLGAGRLWAQGLVLGARDVATGRTASSVLPTRTRNPHIGAGRTQNLPALTAMAEYLADETRANLPVFYYESAWGLDMLLGAAKPVGVYPTDDYLVSDSQGMELRRFLVEHPHSLVIVDKETWAFLLDPTNPPQRTSMFWIGGVRSWPVRFLERWSSSHFGMAVVDEIARKRDRWARTVGGYVRDHYRPAARFGNLLVLQRPQPNDMGQVGLPRAGTVGSSLQRYPSALSRSISAGDRRRSAGPARVRLVCSNHSS